MKRLVLILAVLAMSCGDDAPKKKALSNNGANNGVNNGTTGPNNGTTGPNNGTIAPNNGTIAPNNGTVAPNNGTTPANNGTVVGPACDRFQPSINAFIGTVEVMENDTIPNPSTIVLSAPVTFTGATEVVAWRWQTAMADGSLTWDGDQNTDSETIQINGEGTYQVRVTAWDEAGINGPGCSTSFSFVAAAAPVDSIHFQLTWTGPADPNPNDDVGPELDIYYKRASDQWGAATGVNWRYPNADWPPAGPNNNAALDIDFTKPPGPENINHVTPADGDYEVAVHFFDDHAAGYAQADVRLFINGTQTERYTSPINNKGDLWVVGTISWPSGVFTPNGSVISNFMAQ